MSNASISVWFIYIIFIVPGVYLLSYASLQFWVIIYKPEKTALKRFFDNISLPARFVVDFAPMASFVSLHDILLANRITQVILFLCFGITGILLIAIGFLPLLIALSQGVYVNYLPVFIVALLTVIRTAFFGVRIKDAKSS
jgi:hypothetical protein